jgi:hypothetical protein
VLIWAALPRELRAQYAADRGARLLDFVALQALAHARGLQRGLRQPQRTDDQDPLEPLVDALQAATRW